MVGVPPYEGDPSPSTKPPATIVDLRPLFLRCVLTASSAIASARTVSSSCICIGGGGGGGSKITINQANEFGAGDVVRYDASTALYVKALATTTEFAEAIGIIE